MKNTVLLFLLAALLMACSGVTPPTAPTGSDPNAPVSSDSTPAAVGDLPSGPLAWQVSDLGGSVVTPTDPLRYQITFKADGSMGIQADCNQAGGSYKVNGTMIDIALGASTMIGCPPDTQDAEFLRQLDAVTEYRMDGETLQLLFPDGGGSMHFAAADAGASQGSSSSDPVALAGTEWTITAYTDPAQQTMGTTLQDTPATILFTKEGNVQGNTGCNIFGGSYTQEGTAISMSAMTRTEIACDEAHNRQEQHLITALSAADTVVITGNQLELRQGDTVLIQATAP